MKKTAICVVGIMIALAICAGFAWAYDESGSNSLFGYQAGQSNPTGGAGADTFIGCQAGYYTTFGGNNTFIGYRAGFSNISGNNNTFLGYEAGYGSSLNTAVTGSVFIGYQAGYNDTTSNRLYIDNSGTATPLIYGEFDNNLVVINGVLSIASSREYKKNINHLKVEKAIETLQNLNPVEFSYKATPSERHIGFISEEVPAALTARERKAVSAMDIVAVLTKVVQEQQKAIHELAKEVKELKRELRLRAMTASADLPK